MGIVNRCPKRARDTNGLEEKAVPKTTATLVQDCATIAGSVDVSGAWVMARRVGRSRGSGFSSFAISSAIFARGKLIGPKPVSNAMGFLSDISVNE